MWFKRYLLTAVAASLVLPAWTHSDLESRTFEDPICVEIAGQISSASAVFYPINIGKFTKGIYHWILSSTQVPKCVVEPATEADVAIILKIVGSTRTPFAVKGGGHASNPGFSSTTGVHIAMYRFSEVTYDSVSQTAVIGAGLIWDDVYTALEEHGVTVVGGRVTGVGVAGFTLGGGYSWYTNQYGLTVDNILAYELVKPDGTIATVTEDSDSDLFFALKGGFNNFGIVTKFTMKAYPLTQVWGGLITFTEDQIPHVNSAVINFTSSVTDPKAGIISTYNFLLGGPGISQILFYDGPTPPPGMFDDFLAIPSFTKDISTRSLVSLVQASPSNATADHQGIFHTVSLIEYSPNILNAIVNESIFWGVELGFKTAGFISYDVEPFLPTIFTHGSASAYPPTRSQGLSPLNLYFSWSSSLLSDDFYDAIRQSAAQITRMAVAEGQPIEDAPLYGNYAIFDTPLTRIFGDSISTLQVTKARVDPDNVMGLAGGWKL